MARKFSATTDPNRIAAKGILATDDSRCIVLLVAIQVVVTMVVAPRGNFGVSDDWTYAHSVLWLLGEHRIRLSEWATTNLLPQILMGGVATAIFGFSFEVLRHLTQVVAIAASVAAYAWFREARLQPKSALVASVAMLAMPSWPLLANSFMSDLYGLAFALAAAALFLRALNRFTWRVFAAAALVGAIGVLERQMVVVVPIAFGVAWLWGNRQWSASSLAIALAPLAVALVAELAYLAYLGFGPGVPDTQQQVYAMVAGSLWKAITGAEGYGGNVLDNFLTIGGYVGLFLAGWALWWGMRGATPTVRALVVCSGALIAVVALTFDWLPPYHRNFTIEAAGIGPFTLYDGLPRELANFDRSPGFVWRVAGVAAAFGIAALVALTLATLAYLIKAGRGAARNRVFIAALAFASLAPFIAIGYIDRYLLFSLPFLFALWSLTWPADESAPASWRRGVALAWIIVVIGLSAAATRDFFSWNRVRWDAIHIAERLGATPETLDGGYEYNGFTRLANGMVPRVAGKSWWWVKDDVYVVAFTAVPGYEEIETLRVPHWLSRSPREIKLLRRSP
jgi:Dolichyl-phosphate-mannose-protein mannosyltransferase